MLGGPAQVTCPIGGERFEALQTSHYSTFGMRPDFRPYSYWIIPLPIPECPSNGLVMFQSFDAAQLRKLETLIATPEYRALRQADTTYYRASWLARQLGLGEITALNLLVPAIWQVKPARGQVGQAMRSSEKAHAYQEELIRGVAALPPAWDAEDYRGLYLAAANAARELGRFAEARRMLDEIIARTPSKDQPTQAVRLLVAVQRRDAAVEPLDLIPKMEAAVRCVSPGPTGAFETTFCVKPDMAADIARVRQALEASQKQ